MRNRTSRDTEILPANWRPTFTPSQLPYHDVMCRAKISDLASSLETTQVIPVIR